MEDSEGGVGLKKLDRRNFLKLGVASAVEMAMGDKVTDGSKGVVGSKGEIRQRQEWWKDIETMNLRELKKEVLENYPVIPQIEPIAERLRQITIVPEGSILMRVGTSVAEGMLESVFGENVNLEEIDFGEDQNKLELVLGHLSVPDGVLDAATMYGTDVEGLLNERLFCDQTRYGIPCLPGQGIIPAYVEHLDPKVAVNFVGTNMIRDGVELGEFARVVGELVDYYVNKRVIPLLTTLPHAPTAEEEPYKTWFDEPKIEVHQGQNEQEEIERIKRERALFLPENAFKYNLVLLRLAERNRIPIINLERGVVESAEHDGTKENLPRFGNEIDPLHFSMVYGDLGVEQPPFVMPDPGEKFPTGERAVSYFVVQTLYEIIINVNKGEFGG